MESRSIGENGSILLQYRSSGSARGEKEIEKEHSEPESEVRSGEIDQWLLRRAPPRVAPRLDRMSEGSQVSCEGCKAGEMTGLP